MRFWIEKAFQPHLEKEIKEKTKELIPSRSPGLEKQEVVDK